MKKVFYPLFTIVSNIMTTTVIISDSFNFRGVELYGISKNVSGLLITFIILSTLLTDMDNNYEYMKFKKILFEFIYSPFAIIWFSSILYFTTYEIWGPYLILLFRFPLFLIIYFSMLLSLFYFYNKLINKLELLNEQNKPVNEQSKSKKKKNRRKKKHTMK